jgi:hypothetical protein
MTGLKIALALILGWLIFAWGLTVEVGILHSWWHFIPVMGKGTAFALSSLAVLFGVLIGIVKVVLLGDE